MTDRDEEEAKRIVRKSRHKSISACGTEYEPIKILIANLHKNIAQSLRYREVEAWNRAIEEGAKIAESFNYLSDCNCDRNERIATAILKLKKEK